MPKIPLSKPERIRGFDIGVWQDRPFLYQSRIPYLANQARWVEE
ncbi:hypothetical protein [Pseudoalteromonas sp. NFXS39]